MNRQISPELAQLWLHARSEYEDIRILEHKLERARLKHMQLHEEIRKLIESDAIPSLTGADTDAAPERSQGPRSFSLHAVTPKGQAGLANVERALSRISNLEDWA